MPCLNFVAGLFCKVNYNRQMVAVSVQPFAVSVGAFGVILVFATCVYKVRARVNFAFKVF